MRPGKIVRLIWISIISLSVFITLLLFAVYLNLFGFFGKIPGLEVLENPRSELACEVYSSDRVLLGKYYGNFNRSPAEYNEISPLLINALIATEDSRFYDHSGIDVKGIVAIVPAILTGQRRGSSTITQQLAKNLFRLRSSAEYTGFFSNNVVITKIKEWFVALRIEQAYTKQEIILMYLNTVEFGPNAHGIKSACRKYFNTTPDKLKVDQAALLVGLLKGPSYYSPVKYPERALNRRNTVLSQMVKYDYLPLAAYDTLKGRPLKLQLTNDDESTGMAIHFRNYIKPVLVKWCEEHGRNLYEDGLRVYTTIDSRMQQYAELAMSEHMKYLQSEFNKQWKGQRPWTDESHHEIKGFVQKMVKNSDRYRELKAMYGDDDAAILNDLKRPVPSKLFSWRGTIDTVISPLDSAAYMLRFLHAGFMSMDPRSGDVKAWVGDIDGRFFKYDHVKQGKRQPGSTFKPILYSYAMDIKGLTPESKVMDVEQVITLPDGKQYTPKNSNGEFSNTELTLKQALGRSVNSVAIYLMNEVGPDSLVAFAKRMGFKSQLDATFSLALGGGNDVSVYEMVNAYSVFVNEGYYVRPVLITRIEDKYGNILDEFKTETHQVIAEQTAYYMTELLQGSVEEEGGTSTALKSKYNLPGELGGKTGTTQGSADGWFIGITPELVSGCWVGGESRAIRFKSMALGQGAKMALPVWALYMQKVYNDNTLGYAKYTFDKPDGDAPREHFPMDTTGAVMDIESVEQPIIQDDDENAPPSDF